MDRHNIRISSRLKRAIEIELNFKKVLGKSMNQVPKMAKFVSALNNWVKDDEYSSGSVYISDLNKYLVYQLNAIDHTVVRVSDTLPD